VRLYAWMDVHLHSRCVAARKPCKRPAYLAHGPTPIAGPGASLAQGKGPG
jgi:hypothetical protein